MPWHSPVRCISLFQYLLLLSPTSTAPPISFGPCRTRPCETGTAAVLTIQLACAIIGHRLPLYAGVAIEPPDHLIYYESSSLPPGTSFFHVSVFSRRHQAAAVLFARSLASIPLPLSLTYLIFVLPARISDNAHPTATDSLQGPASGLDVAIPTSPLSGLPTSSTRRLACPLPHHLGTDLYHRVAIHGHVLKTLQTFASFAPFASWTQF